MEKTEIITLFIIISSFVIIAIASNVIAKIFQKIRLPLITGFIVIGAITGPYLLGMLSKDLTNLNFINDISLGFIAFAAGGEIYMKEVRDKIRNISIMSIAQFFITFIISFILAMLLANVIPFMQGVENNIKIAIALLISTIFIASSPASLIAIINELRAKGPFTKVALGVTILKDIFVIILFAITFAIASVLVHGLKFNFGELLIVIIDLVLSITLGLVYGKIIELNFKIDKNEFTDIIIILLIGWSMFALESLVTNFSGKYMQTPIHLEALLIGLIASFYLTNFSKHRTYIQKLVEKYGKYIYVVFFTYIGANLALNVIIKYWAIAFLLFGVRLLAVIIASIVGSIALKETKKKTLFSWSPYVTQAGVSLGLITIVSTHFLGFGIQFEAILIAVIVLNQFIGPPLMKWAIVSVGEAHVKSKDYKYDYVNDIYIFGVGGKAILLAKTMQKQNYNVKIITDKKNIDISECKSVPILHVDKINYKTLQNHNFKNADTVIIFRKEKEAYEICELIYEKFGTPNIMVVMKTHNYVKKFKELGVLVISQTSALITLLTDFVRSPHATQILLGMQEEQETQDITILAKDIHGHALRDIKLPMGLLLLSIYRNNEVILPHGYTRLRLHDVVTVVGTQDQVEIIRTKFQVN